MVRLTGATGLILAGTLLAGCSTSSMSSLLGGAPEPRTTVSAQAAPDLSMPPDLQLPPPGSAPPPAAAQTYDTASLDPAPGTVAAAPSQPGTGDIYDQFGISKFHPDGRKKTDEELRTELKQAYLARKKQQNPGYGTIFNIGSLFSDG